jgi:hypothetical protein
LGALLEDAGLEVTLGAMSGAMIARFHAKQPTNILLRLRELDNAAAAAVLLAVFDANRFEAIASKVRELRAPKARGYPRRA